MQSEKRSCKLKADWNKRKMRPFDLFGIHEDQRWMVESDDSVRVISNYNQTDFHLPLIIQPL